MSENHVNHGHFVLVMLALFAVAASVKYGGNMTAMLSPPASTPSPDSSAQGTYEEPTDEKAVLQKTQEAAQILAENPTVQDYERAQEIHVEARNWQFSPSQITLQQGKKTFLDFVGVDREYAVAIPELHLDMLIPKAGTSSLLIPTGEARTYEFHCSSCLTDHPPHPEMTGKIIIEKAPDALKKS